MAEGLTVIAIGFILLGNTLGIVPWGVWWNIATLWPLLLITAGMDIIGRGMDNTWLRVLASLLVIGGLVWGVFVMPVNSGNWSPWGPFVVSPLSSSGTVRAFDNAKAHDSTVLSGKARVGGGVGTLTITGGTDLVSASGEGPFDPVFDVSASGSRADVTVGMGSGSWVVPRDNARIEVKLDRSVEWDLVIDAGVSKIDADVRDLKLTALEVKAGVSTGTVTLGSIAAGSGSVPVKLDTGVSTVTLRIPEGQGARLTVDKGLSNIQRPSGLTRSSEKDGKDVYETSGLASGSRYWDITLDAGISNVRIEFY